MVAMALAAGAVEAVDKPVPTRYSQAASPYVQGPACVSRCNGQLTNLMPGQATGECTGHSDSPTSPRDLSSFFLTFRRSGYGHFI